MTEFKPGDTVERISNSYRGMKAGDRGVVAEVYPQILGGGFRLVADRTRYDTVYFKVVEPEPVFRFKVGDTVKTAGDGEPRKITGLGLPPEFSTCTKGDVHYSLEGFETNRYHEEELVRVPAAEEVEIAWNWDDVEVGDQVSFEILGHGSFSLVPVTRAEDGGYRAVLGVPVQEVPESWVLTYKEKPTNPLPTENGSVILVESLFGELKKLHLIKGEWTSPDSGKTTRPEAIREAVRWSVLL